MNTIGFLPKSSSTNESLFCKQQYDSDWYDFCQVNNFKYDDSLYFVSNPTHFSVHKAALKYDVPVKEPSDFDQKIHREAYSDLLDFFSTLKGKCGIIPLDEVDYNPDATVAFCVQNFGVRTKDEAVALCWDYIQQFNETAHLLEYPTLWKLFGKIEHLNHLKIEGGDIRSILTIPVELFFSLASLSQDLNERMCLEDFFNTTPSKHGVNLLHGGFTSLFNKLEFQDEFFTVQGDCSKWDSRCMPFLLQICKRLRFDCWDKEGMSVQEWQQRMDYYYDQIINTRFVTSTGEVFQKFLGQPSGTTSTTDDNIIMHLYVLCYIWRKLFGKSLYVEHGSKVRMAIYADDHVFTLRPERSEFASFEVRKALYDHFGLILKLDDDLVTNSLEGHTFLGLTARKILGRYRPVFKRSRILNAVGKYAVGKPFTPAQKFDRAQVYMLLATFDLPTWEFLHSYCAHLKSKYFELHNVLLWNRRHCISLWSGDEIQSRIQRQINLDAHVSFSEGGRNKKDNMSSKSVKEFEAGKITKAELNKRIKQSEQTRKAQKKKKVSASPNDNMAVVLRPKFTNGQGARMPPGSLRTTVPRNVPTSSLGGPALAYLKTLVDPANYKARIPDSYARSTSVLRSVNSFSVPISQDQYNVGRFSFCCQPIFGNVSTPTQFQNAVVSAAQITANATTWGETASWGDSDTYISFSESDGMGSDPRVDTNSPFLTSLPPSFWGVTFGTSVADLNSKTLVSGVAANQTVAPDSTSPVIHFLSPASFPGVSGGIIVLPFGDWNISLICKFQCSGTGEAYEAINFQSCASEVSYIGITQQQTPVAAAGTTYLAACTAQVASSPGKNSVSFCLANTQAGLANAVASTVVNQVSASYITITPANFTSSSVYSDAGVIQEVRPVAMAVLVTYMGTLLNNGGEIAINLLPNSSIQNRFFQTNNSGGGQLQFYENLRKTDSCYDGKIKDGAYCIWCPFDSTDSKMVDVATLNSGTYPAIVCSGIFAPDSTVNTAQPTLRVMTYTVWEFVTTYTMFETQKCVGSQAMVDAAQNCVKLAPFGTANGKHLAYIKNLISKGAKWIGDNRSWLVPAATAFGALL